MRDPTQTTSIRQALIRRYSAEYRSLRGDILRYMDRQKFPMTPADVRKFSKWLDARSMRVVSSIDLGEYVLKAYGNGVARAGISNVLNKNHGDKIGALYGMLKADTEAARQAMVSQVIERMNDASIRGAGPTEVLEEVRGRINKVGLTRSITSANTVIPFASNVGGVEAAGQSNAKMMFQWHTRQDEKVRTSHALRNMKIYSEQVGLNLLGEPNCRCWIEPVVEIDQDKFKKVRDAGLKISVMAQKEQRFWRTLDIDKQARGYVGD